METINVKLGKLKINKDNPRTITKEKMDKLVNSILVFPKMLDIRPIVVDSGMTVLGGNQRTEALRKISRMSPNKIAETLSSISDFKKMREEEKKDLIRFWESWLKNKEVQIINADNLTEEEKKQFVIKDNNSYGEWDLSELEKNWDREILKDWGMDFPDDWKKKERRLSETEKLSEIEYVGIYYEPKNIPRIRLKDCVNLDKFNAKVKALDNYNISKQQKEVLKLFAYRFIKIDFEAVANYYAFNATEEEKKAMERLRLVLIDNGDKGFIEDDMLKLLKSDINYLEEGSEE